MTEVRRGDVVVVADRAGGDYAGKPRPALVLQADLFPDTSAVIVALIVSVSPEWP